MLRSYDLVGYKYEGVTYSENELINDFEISSLNFNPSLKSVSVEFSNREYTKVTSLSRGSVNGLGQLLLVKWVLFWDLIELDSNKLSNVKIREVWKRIGI